MALASMFKKRIELPDGLAKYFFKPKTHPFSQQTMCRGWGIRLLVALFGLFRLFSFCFGTIETPKYAVSILKRNNRNKHLVLDNFKTSFGFSLGCFESKLVS
jgi:phosphoglycerol transferase MdoB-like AlkP superfamily enzyme